MSRGRYDWESIRAEWEAGASATSLAKKYGCSKTAIQKRIAKEGWSRDLEPEIRRKVAEKVAGVVAPGNPEKRREAVEGEAARRAAVERRHRTEWEEVTELRREAIEARHDDVQHAFERAKLARILAEVTAIKQKGERAAWRLDDARESGRVEVVIRRGG